MPQRDYEPLVARLRLYGYEAGRTLFPELRLERLQGGIGCDGWIIASKGEN